MYDNEFETRDKISEDKIEPHHTYSISCGDTEGAMVMYDNEFETRDKISEDKIEPHHTYSISYGDTEGAMCPVINGLNLEKMKGLSFPWDKPNCP